MADGTKWTDDEDKRLMELWRERHSFSEMAWDFPGRSRNACIGRLGRLRKILGTEMVPPGKEGRPGLPVAQKRKRVRRKPMTNYAIQRQAAIAAAPLVMKGGAPQLATARRLSLLQLGPKDCRFIVTDHQTRQHLYCALDASAFVDNYGNGCYCAFHRRLMRASGVVR